MKDLDKKFFSQRLNTAPLSEMPSSATPVKTTRSEMAKYAPELLGTPCALAAERAKERSLVIKRKNPVVTEAEKEYPNKKLHQGRLRHPQRQERKRPMEITQIGLRVSAKLREKRDPLQRHKRKFQARKAQACKACTPRARCTVLSTVQG